MPILFHEFRLHISRSFFTLTNLVFADSLCNCIRNIKLEDLRYSIANVICYRIPALRNAVIAVAIAGAVPRHVLHAGQMVPVVGQRRLQAPAQAVDGLKNQIIFF